MVRLNSLRPVFCKIGCITAKTASSLSENYASRYNSSLTQTKKIAHEFPNR